MNTTTQLALAIPTVALALRELIIAEQIPNSCHLLKCKEEGNQYDFLFYLGGFLVKTVRVTCPLDQIDEAWKFIQTQVQSLARTQKGL